MEQRLPSGVDPGSSQAGISSSSSPIANPTCTNTSAIASSVCRRSAGWSRPSIQSCEPPAASGLPTVPGQRRPQDRGRRTAASACPPTTRSTLLRRVWLTQAAGGRVLQRPRQPGSLAALPHGLHPPGVRSAALADLSRSERAVRPGDRRGGRRPPDVRLRPGLPLRPVAADAQGGER